MRVEMLLLGPTCRSTSPLLPSNPACSSHLANMPRSHASLLLFGGHTMSAILERWLLAACKSKSKDTRREHDRDL